MARNATAEPTPIAAVTPALKAGFEAAVVTFAPGTCPRSWLPDGVAFTVSETIVDDASPGMNGAEIGVNNDKSDDAHSTDIGHWYARKLYVGIMVVVAFAPALISAVLLADEVQYS